MTASPQLFEFTGEEHEPYGKQGRRRTNVQSSAPSATDQDLGHPHACMDGWVYLSFTAIHEETGEEVERVEALPCRRCIEERANG